MRWIRRAVELLGEIERTQEEAIEAAATIAARVIGSGGVVHTFGTGHSRMAVEEMFPRYGSYPGFHPVVELSMTFYTQVGGANGMRQAMFIERVEGLAEQILANYELRPTDAAIVFSVSGLNAVPIEMAMGLRKAGVPVIAVTSMRETNAVEPGHPSGTRLADHADVVIDLCTPVGDALCGIDGLTEPVGPRQHGGRRRRGQRDQGPYGRAAGRGRPGSAGHLQRQARRAAASRGAVRGRLSGARPQGGRGAEKAMSVLVAVSHGGIGSACVGR
ncbi:sugar isomerase domain-containing protein [Nonomuraea dietziae]|uniref:sugar isomerase domain-containing protein n=1 Tax=Nonomuraea dietziae TaxID=65515 RepID=UPI0031E15E68